MSDRQGLVSGLLISLVLAVFTALTQWLSSYWVSPAYFPNMIEYATAQGMMTMEEAREYFSSSNYMLQSFIAAPILGLLTSAILMIFLRSKPEKTA
jgi:phosphate/sulfate permease